MEEETYWDSINYLKGLIIITVLLFHYYKIGNYANTLIAIFFVLSGYGLYYSFEKRFKDGISAKKVLEFYLVRFIKIYSLLYLGFFLNYYFFGVVPSNLDYTGLYLQGSYWFISAIIHCYLIAIPLYYMVKKMSVWNYLVYVTAAMVFLNLTYFMYLRYFITVAVSEPLMYRFFFMPYLLLFAYGMTLPYFLKKYSDSISDKIPFLTTFIILVAILVKIISLNLVKFLPNVPVNYYYISYLAIFILITPMLIFFFLIFSKRLKPPYSYLVSLFGKYSLSLYLFHTIYFTLLDSDFPKGKIPELSWHLLWSVPVFLIFCMVIEELSDYIRSKIIQ